MMMPPQQQQRDEIQRDLQATLAARRELGSEYDDHFLDALAEKLTAQAQRAVANAPRDQPPSNRLSRDQRAGVAICSLFFGIPIIAITVGNGPWYFLGAIALIGLINLLATR